MEMAVIARGRYASAWHQISIIEIQSRPE